MDTSHGNGTLLGYARVSTTDQDLSLQTDALTGAGCTRIFTDTASGSKADRPGLDALLDYARHGDTLVVWKLDRLGRSMAHLLATVQHLDRQGVGFQSLTESLDTTSPGGRLVFNIFGAMAEFERDLIRERTVAGLAAARARGRVGGRPVTLTPQRLADAQALLDAGRGMTEVARTLGVGRSTLYRRLSPSG